MPARGDAVGRADGGQPHHANRTGRRAADRLVQLRSAVPELVFPALSRGRIAGRLADESRERGRPSARLAARAGPTRCVRARRWTGCRNASIKRRASSSSRRSCAGAARAILCRGWRRFSCGIPWSAGRTSVWSSPRSSHGLALSPRRVSCTPRERGADLSRRSLPHKRRVPCPMKYYAPVADRFRVNGRFVPKSSPAPAALRNASFCRAVPGRGAAPPRPPRPPPRRRHALRRRAWDGCCWSSAPEGWRRWACSSWSSDRT